MAYACHCMSMGRLSAFYPLNPTETYQKDFYHQYSGLRFKSKSLALTRPGSQTVTRPGSPTRISLPVATTDDKGLDEHSGGHDIRARLSLLPAHWQSDTECPQSGLSLVTSRSLQGSTSRPGDCLR